MENKWGWVVAAITTAIALYQSFKKQKSDDMAKIVEMYRGALEDVKREFKEFKEEVAHTRQELAEGRKDYQILIGTLKEMNDENLRLREQLKLKP